MAHDSQQFLFGLFDLFGFFACPLLLMYGLIQLRVQLLHLVFQSLIPGLHRPQAGQGKPISGKDQAGSHSPEEHPDREVQQRREKNACCKKENIESFHSLSIDLLCKRVPFSIFNVLMSYVAACSIPWSRQEQNACSCQANRIYTAETSNY